MSTQHVLDNIAWHTLAGEHRRHSVGDRRVKRYRAGFSPIAAFADPLAADLAWLSLWFAPSETAIVSGIDRVPRGTGWQRSDSFLIQQMVWAGRSRPSGDNDIDVVPLQPQHVAAMVELVRQGPPGPFTARAAELGRFYGVFDGARLVAMAGQRMRAGGYVQLSAICTLASHRRQGLARALIVRQLAEGVAHSEVPFLHVAEHNHAAIVLYESLGFRRRRGVVLTKLCRDEERQPMGAGFERAAS